MKSIKAKVMLKTVRVHHYHAKAIKTRNLDFIMEKLDIQEDHNSTLGDESIVKKELQGVKLIAAVLLHIPRQIVCR